MNIPIISASHNGDFNTGKRINVVVSDNALILGIAYTIEGIDVFNESGYWESDIIDLSKYAVEYNNLIINFTAENGSALTVFTATSNDMVAFSEYEETGVGGLIASPFGRYIKIKVNFEAGIDNQVNVLNTFSSGEAIEFVNDQYLMFDGSLKLKTAQVFQLVDQSSLDPEFELYSVNLKSSDFFKMDTFNLNIYG